MVVMNGSDDKSDGGDINDNSIGNDDIYNRRTELVLVSPSNSYSELDSISVSVNRSTSSSALYCLLTT